MTISFKRIIPLFIIIALLVRWSAQGEEVTPPFGDGMVDATAPIQQLLDSKALTGGEVRLPPGQYLLKGTLTIPPGVTLRGSWGEPHHGEIWDKGSTLLVTAGRGDENGAAAIQMKSNAALIGFTMLWPDQTPKAITPYPWAILGQGKHDSVENVTFVNAYQGIKMGDPYASLHLIRNVFGCVLRRGILIDNTKDVGRLENIHFNPNYWLGSHSPSLNNDEKDSAQEKCVYDFITANLDGFTFARSDWEYVTNTFVWGAKSGYLFTESSFGRCNGQFLGIGGDFCQVCIRIDKVSDIGIQITNGEFTAFGGGPNSAIVTSPEAAGAVQLVNCNFWGIKNHVAWMQGTTAITLSDCHICDKLDAGAVLAENGRLILRGCNFDQSCPAVILKAGVKAAIIAENLQPGGLQVDNGIGSKAVIGLNEKPDDPSK
jgi:hypothetical protein